MAPFSGAGMPDTHRLHAQELRARAALEHDPARQRYLKGLARSYEELARQRGELPEQPEPPAMAHRAGLVALLRARGFTEAHIAGRLGCSEQLVSQLMHEAARAEHG
jgi:hypothetical protein